MDADIQQDRDKYHKALWSIMHEVENKHGGPERSSCVSVTYIYRVCCKALGLPVEDKKWKTSSLEEE